MQWLDKVKTPSYIIDEAKLETNLEILAKLQQETDAKVLLAQKAFSCYYYYPLIAKYLSGFASSGLFELKLAAEYGKGKEQHIFSPAYQTADIQEISELADHLVFNSAWQWEQFRSSLQGKECGLRINPEHSTQDKAIYDPCSPCSRLGIKLEELEEALRRDNNFLDGISGLHFHTLCEQGAEPLAATLAVVEAKFGKYLSQLKWLNLGGGHHITKAGYNLTLLKSLIKGLQAKYQLEIYLEPGEAIALDAGYLVASVVDILEREPRIAILDTSAACHMPDVIEMPYRPPLLHSYEPQEAEYTYLLGGPTCLSGDLIGEYSFHKPLAIGDKLVFQDMAIYTMVKNNTFNGMPLPSILGLTKEQELKVIKNFTYDNFKCRL